MLVLKDTPDALTKNSVCGIGSFDGVHRGHQAIVARLKDIAGAKKKTGIITFTPLPFFVLKHAPICCLTPVEEKNELFSELGLDFAYYFEFTKEFALFSPRDFVSLIARQIEPSTIVVGENFHFGKLRKGNAQLLETLARDTFRVEIMAKVGDEGTISSTRIRELLLLGNIKAGGVGITLTAASDVAFIEYAWTPGDMVQAEDRVHRIGQEEPVTVWHFVAQGTIDEDITELLEKKRNIADVIHDGTAAENAKFGMVGEIMQRLTQEKEFSNGE